MAAAGSGAAAIRIEQNASTTYWIELRPGAVAKLALGVLRGHGGAVGAFEMIAPNASQTKTIRAPIGIGSPARPSG